MAGQGPDRSRSQRSRDKGKTPQYASDPYGDQTPLTQPPPADTSSRSSSRNSQQQQRYADTSRRDRRQPEMSMSSNSQPFFPPQAYQNNDSYSSPYAKPLPNNTEMSMRQEPGPFTLPPAQQYPSASPYSQPLARQYSSQDPYSKPLPNNNSQYGGQPGEYTPQSGHSADQDYDPTQAREEERYDPLSNSMRRYPSGNATSRTATADDLQYRASWTSLQRSGSVRPTTAPQDQPLPQFSPVPVADLEADRKTFTEHSAQLTKDIETLIYNCKQVDKDNVVDSNDARTNEISTVVANTRQLVQSMKVNIEVLRNALASHPKDAISATAGFEFTNVVRRFKNELKKWDAALRKRERALTAADVRFILTIAPNKSEAEAREICGIPGGAAGFARSNINAGRAAALQTTLGNVQSRSDQILNLNQQTSELLDLFTQLSDLVIYQEPMLKQIETNAVEVQENTENANKEVDKSTETAIKKRSRKKKIFWWSALVITLIIAGVTIGMVMKFVKKPASNSSESASGASAASNGNSNGNSNTNNNQNGGLGTNSNDNAVGNVNSNAIGSTNTNGQTATSHSSTQGSSANTNGNANINTNSNVNSNSNSNTNVNTNTKSNTNGESNTNSNLGKRDADAIEAITNAGRTIVLGRAVGGGSTLPKWVL